MPYKDMINFSFSIPNQPHGVAKQDLSHLLQGIQKAKIKLRGISGFASGRRIQFFCVPEDAAKFRGFLKSARIRAKEGGGFSIDGENTVERVMAVLDSIALSGFNMKAFDAFGVGSRAGGLIWSDERH